MNQKIDKLGTNNVRVYSCIGCDKRGDKFKKKDFGQIKSDSVAEKATLIYGTVISIGNYICDLCRHQVNNSYKKQSTNKPTDYSTKEINEDMRNEKVDTFDQTDLIDYNLDEQTDLYSKCFDKNKIEKDLRKKKTNSVYVNIPRTTASHKYCFVCEKNDRKLHRVTNEAIHYAFIQTNIYIIEGSRCCGFHLDEFGNIKNEYLTELKIKSKQTRLNDETVESLILSFVKFGQQNTLFKKFSNVSSINDSISKNNTGFCKSEFIEISSFLKSIRESDSRNKFQALAIYLFWLKTGFDQRKIALHFGIETHFDVFRYLNQVRKALLVEFVPKYLGIEHLSRSEWLQQNTNISKELFAQDENQIILIFDGTYCKVEKSSNYLFQKLTYSEQKKYNLIKPFVGTSPNGRIVDIFGVHPATKNDGEILKHILEKDSKLNKFLQPNDILILDRGFSRVSEYLKEVYKFKPMIPSSLKKDEKQLSTLEANKSRLVTKCRWVVEVLNSFLKKSFRALDGVSNRELKHTLNDYRIAAALINKYFQRLYSDSDDVEIACKMKQKLYVPNDLFNFIKENSLHKKSLFEKIEAAQIEDFPVLKIDEIVADFTYGTYEINQAKSYLGQHFSKCGKIEFYVYNDKYSALKGKILFGEIRSRFKNSVKYKTYINYQPNVNNVQSISSWYCTCICGARTIGCCSHVASLVLFFSNLKYLKNINWPSQYLDKILYPESESSDEETQSLFQETQLTNQTTQSQLTKIENKPSYNLIKRDLSDFNLNCVKKNKNFYSFEKELNQCESLLCSDEICLTILKSKIPKWGGEFSIDNQLVTLTNTCSFDYFLFGIWVNSLLSSNFSVAINRTSSNFLKNSLNEVVNLIENKTWNDVKKFWLITVCQKTPISNRKRNKIDCFGSVYELFGKYVHDLQMYYENCCLNTDCSHKRFKSSRYLELFKRDNETYLNICENRLNCNYCGNSYINESYFNSVPPFLIVDTNASQEVYIQEIPKSIEINKNSFKFLFCNFKSTEIHFKAAFLLKNTYFIIDDLKNGVIKESIPREKIDTCFYYLT